MLNEDELRNALLLVFANKQDLQGSPCAWALDGDGNPPPTGFRYQALLELLQVYEVGWLAWCWWLDR